MIPKLNSRTIWGSMLTLLVIAPAAVAQSDTSAIATPYNDIAIPVVMSPVAHATLVLALALWVTFFLAESFRLNYLSVQMAFQGQNGGTRPKFNAFLWRALTILVSLTIYRWTFLKMVTLCDTIYMGLGDVTGWDTVVKTLHAGIPGGSIFSQGAMGLMYMLSATIITILDSFFFTMRWVILAILYVVGPLCWAFAVSELGLAAVKGWFRATWQVSFWVVFYGILKTAAVPLANYALQAAAPIPTSSTAGAIAAAIASVAANTGSIMTTSVTIAVTFIVCLIEIPMLTSVLFSQGNIGAVSNAVMTIAQTAALAGTGAAMAHSSTNSPLAKGVQSFMNSTAGAAVGSVGSKITAAGQGVSGFISRMTGGSSSTPTDDGASKSLPRTDD